MFSGSPEGFPKFSIWDVFLGFSWFLQTFSKILIFSVELIGFILDTIRWCCLLEIGPILTFFRELITVAAIITVRINNVKHTFQP